MNFDFLCRSDHRVGMGHLVRCRLLAEEVLARGGSARIHLMDPPEPLCRQLEGHRIPTAEWRGAFATEHGILVTDLGHEPLPRGLLPFADGRRHLARIGPAAAAEGGERWLIDTNPRARPETVDFAGPTYLPIPSAIRDLRPEQTTAPTFDRRLLITFGGSDPHHLTRSIVEAITTQDINWAEVCIVLGPLFPDPEGFKTWAFQRLGTRLELHVATSDMPALLASCDLAIASTGLTWFELACLGKPTLVVAGSEHEVATAQRLKASGHAYVLGEGETGALRAGQWLADPQREEEQLAACQKAAFELVDGRGAQRLIDALWQSAP